MSSAAEQIKERLSIQDVVGSYIKLEKSGGNYKARCPFHTEKTPSFYISPARGSYYCFGCGAKGDIFTFVQEYEKVNFVEALKILADRAGIQLEQFKSDVKNEFENLRKALEMATIFFEGELQHNPEALKYLHERGLTDETIKQWRIGYAPAEWRSLHDHLLKQGVGVKDMEEAGLVKRSEKETVTSSSTTGAGRQNVYDRFRGRIIFPLFDSSGKVIAYSGRIFGADAEKKGPDGSLPAKYLNSPETPLFNKSEVLYGYHKAKEGMRQWGYGILVEGQMDLLMCHQAGFNNAVATSGTALTEKHLDKIKKMSNNVMIVYDADKAGLKATVRAWTAALSLGMDVKIAALPAGEDPASILLSNKEKFKEALKHSKHIIDYYLDVLIQQKLPERALWKGIETEVVPYIAAIESAIDRAHFITTVSIRTSIPEDALREQVQKAMVTQSSEGSAVQPTVPIASKESASSSSNSVLSEPIQDKVLERIIGYILLEKAKKTEDEKVAKLLDRVRTIIGDTEYKEIEKVIQEAPENILFEAEMMFSGSLTIEKDVEELFISLEEKVLKNQFALSMKELQQAERAQDKHKALEILQRCQNISLQLSKLNHKRKQL